MDDRDVASRWHGNSDVWSRHVRAGYDTFRDHLNNPAFLSLIGDIDGMVALDAGCGEGYNTRLLARCGARMTGVDIADGMIEQARVGPSVVLRRSPDEDQTSEPVGRTRGLKRIEHSARRHDMHAVETPEQREQIVFGHQAQVE